MGLFMRFFVSSDEGIDLQSIRLMLAEEVGLQVIVGSIGDSIDVYSGKDFVAQITVDGAGSEILLEDVAEFRDVIGPPTMVSDRVVLEHLNHTTSMVVAEVFWEGSEPATSFMYMDRLWSWLFSRVDGVLQVDGEGFYDAESLLVARHFNL